MTGEAPLSPSIGPDTQPVDRDGWSRIVEAARTDEDGAWVPLPENGWGAVEHLIADYCALAGIPTPPFTAWDLRPPDGVTRQDLEAAAFEEPTGHPVALVGVVRRLLAEP